MGISKRTLAASVFTLGVLFSNATLASVFVYTKPDGSTLITDKRIHKKGYYLKRSYKTKPYRSGVVDAPYFAKPIKSQYDALIVNTALKYNLEPAFIKAVIHVESAFDHLAVSKAGAMGLMQLMPATAADYELTTNTFAPSRNVEAGVRHMRDLMDRYDSNMRLSLAAYNAGSGAVSKYNGIPPFKETQNYVVKVMKLYRLYQREI